MLSAGLGGAPDWFFRTYFDRSDLNLHDSNEGVLLVAFLKALALAAVVAAALLVTVAAVARRDTLKVVAVVHTLLQFWGGLYFCWFVYRPAVALLRPGDNEASTPLRYTVAYLCICLLLLFLGIRDRENPPDNEQASSAVPTKETAAVVRPIERSAAEKQGKSD